MKNVVEITFIIDKSGSMCDLVDETIIGFNTMIKEQKKLEGEVVVNTVLFNHSLELLHKNEKLSNVKPITKEDYKTTGYTALLDAIGISINKILMKHLSVSKEDRPNKTLFIITTDGEENSSKRFNYNSISNLIAEVKKTYGYEFIFSGANIDTKKEAEKLNIDEYFSYEASDIGIFNNYEEMCMCIEEKRKD
ncbi:MAG: hypothetical protein R3Y60_02500 [bacterium]